MGSKQFTNPVCEMDVRPGGAWRIIMRSSESVELKGVYRQGVRPERLVMIMDLSEHPDAWHDLLDPGRDKSKGRPSLDVGCAVSFAEDGGKTRVTIVRTFETSALRDAIVKMGLESGWNQSLHRLADLLRRR